MDVLLREVSIPRLSLCEWDLGVEQRGLRIGDGVKIDFIFCYSSKVTASIVA